MTKRLILLGAALLLALTPALCQGEDALGGDMGEQSQMLPPGHPPIEGRGGAAEAQPAGRPLHWNPQSVQEFQGTITALGPAVETEAGQRPQPIGSLMMAMDTPKGPEQVLLGPSWYLYGQEPHLKLGDQVKVTGSVIDREGQRLVLAQKVDKDGQTLTLRDESGRPVWAGAPMGRGMAPSKDMGGRGGGCPMGQGGMGGMEGMRGGSMGQ